MFFSLLHNFKGIFTCKIFVTQNLGCIMQFINVTELKDTLEHVGAALKQKLMDSMRSTWNTVYQLAMFHKTDDRSLEQEVNKVSNSIITIIFLVGHI